MAIAFKCEHCQAAFEVPEQHAGKRGNCPHCKHPLTVPGAPDKAATSGIRRARLLEAPLPPPAAPRSTKAPAPPPGPEPAFPSFQNQMAAPGATRAEPKVRPRKSAANTFAWIAAGGGAALVLILGIVLFMGDGQPPAAAPPQPQSQLVLDWNEADRLQATLSIDGRPQTLPATGKLSFNLPPGDHQLVLKRPGYEKVHMTVLLQPGRTLKRFPLWAAVPPAAPVEQPDSGPKGFAGWGQDFATAQQDAQQRGTEVLLLFAGSDWDNHTQRLANRVLGTAQFRDEVKGRFELVVIDFPRSEEGRSRMRDQAHNQRLQQLLGVENVPTVVLSDARGLPYAVDSPQEETVTAQGFLEWLGELQEKRAERDRLLQAAAQGDDSARLTAALETIRWLRPRNFTPFYQQPLDDWLTLAQRLDADNSQGQHEEIFQDHWFNRFRAATNYSPAEVKGVVDVLDGWIQSHKFQDPDRGARLCLIGLELMINLGDEDAAARLIASAQQYQPKDGRLAERVTEYSKFLKGRGQLGSGTGFVVAEKGYILTNHHVVEGEEGRVVVRLEGSEEPVPATVVHKDEERDLALLQVVDDAAQRLPPIPLDPATLSRGVSVAAFGYALGDFVGSGIKLTEGIVTALPETDTKGMLTVSCSINPGNSGGPLCNKRGQVVGIVTAKTRSGGAVDSYGMVIPTSDILRYLTRVLPDYRPAPPREGPRLEWNEVDELVSPSVVRVLKVR